MSTSSEFTVSAQVDAHTEAARSGTSRLILTDLGLGLIRYIPHVDPAVVCRAGQVAAVFTQSQRPNLAGLDGRASDFTTGVPLSSLLVQCPDLDFAAKARASSILAVS